MADYKVVDAEQLDADLTIVADAIREKGGTTEPLEFPLGMKQAVEAIQSGGGSGIDIIEQKIINGSYEYENVNITEVPINVFTNDKFLTKCSLPNVVIIGTNAFYSCSALTEINFPNLQQTYQQSLGNTGVKNVYLPKLTRLSSDLFNYCQKLEKAEFSVANNIEGYAFNRCNSLKTLIFRHENVVALNDSNSFNHCYHYDGTKDSTYNPNGLKDGYVYVPRNLIASYQTATNWSVLYANHNDVFRALEDYTVDGTVTGAFDESKI